MEYQELFRFGAFIGVSKILKVVSLNVLIDGRQVGENFKLSRMYVNRNFGSFGLGNVIN